VSNLQIGGLTSRKLDISVTKVAEQEDKFFVFIYGKGKVEQKTKLEMTSVFISMLKSSVIKATYWSDVDRRLIRRPYLRLNIQFISKMQNNSVQFSNSVLWNLEHIAFTQK